MTKRIVIVTYPRHQVLDVAGPHEVFAGADATLRAEGRPGYSIEVVALGAGAVPSQSGLTIYAAGLDTIADGPLDTLVVPGGHGVYEAAADQRFVAAVRALAARSRRVTSVCTGAFALAAAGLVDGKRVTTHWARGERLAAAFPSVIVDTDPIWTRDGNVWTSAGVTAGIDLALALVEDDAGAEVATTVARHLVMFMHRQGGQSQFAAPIWRPTAAPGPVRAAQELIDHDPADDHRVVTLARRVAMSERHFIRRFSAELGVTPARYVTAARLDAARRELERDDGVSIAGVARRVGFGTSESMRRAFVRHLGTTPDQYRRRFHRRTA